MLPDNKFKNFILSIQDKIIFITGTDTNVGKTYITCKILNIYNDNFIKSIGYKPYCSGNLSDVDLIFKNSSPEFNNNSNNKKLIYNNYYKHPVSPLSASKNSENNEDNFEIIVKNITKLASKYDKVIVEGIGGWETPITKNNNLSDFAKLLNSPVLLVSADRLGMLNHTILTFNSITKPPANLHCKAIIINDLHNICKKNYNHNYYNNYETLSLIKNMPKIFNINYSK